MSNQQLIIRKINYDDLDQVLKLDQALFDSSLTYSFDQWNKMIESNLYLCLGLFLDQKLVSLLLVMKNDQDVEIDKIATDIQYQRKHYGQKLIDHFFTNYSFNNCFLEVKQTNTKAINFYFKNGFEIINCRKNYYQKENAIILKKIKNR